MSNNHVFIPFNRKKECFIYALKKMQTVFLKLIKLKKILLKLKKKTNYLKFK